MRGDVHADIRPIFTYPDLASAQARHKEIIAKDTKTADKLTAWMDAKIPQGFTVYALLEAKRRRMRTSNALERVNQELKYRTRVTSQEKLPQHEPLGSLPNQFASFAEQNLHHQSKRFKGRPCIKE